MAGGEHYATSAVAAPKAMPARIRLSTDDLPAQERLGFWHECHGRQLCNVGIRAHDETPYAANADILQLGSCAIFRLHSARAQYYVAKEYLPTAPEMTALVFVESGVIHGRQRGQEATIGAGQAFAILSNEIGSIDVIQAGSFLNVYLPTAAVAAVVPDLSRALLSPLSQQSTALQLLAGYARTALSVTTNFNPALAALTAGQITSLAATAIGDPHLQERRSDTCTVRAARRRAIKADIAANLHQHSLSPDDIARRLGITPRYMRKILQDEGTSFSDLVRQMRLQKARELLSDARCLDRPISSIAYDVGFGDLSHFNRLFRQQFGAAPRDIRELATRNC
jgi:AraC-like DNA-binding protein